MILLHFKQNKTKLSKKCHSHNTRIGSGYIHMKDNLSDDGTSKIDPYERQFEWWRDEQNWCTYDNVKTAGARGTPCKCCSRLRQRSSPGLRLRLTELWVLIARVWWISHSLITSSSALDNIWQSTSHTPVVEEVAGPRDVCQAALTAIFPSGVLQQLFECLPQSLPNITY